MALQHAVDSVVGPPGLNQTGLHVSVRGACYQTRFSAPRTAGYIGLKDTQALMTLLQSSQWNTLSAEFDRLGNRSVDRIDDIFDMLESPAHRARLRNPGIIPRVTDVLDLCAWTIIHIIDYAAQLPGPPNFGPSYGECELEAYNRAWQLMQHHRWLQYRSWRSSQDHQNQAAILPAFMQVRPPTDYPLHYFTAFWVNRQQEENFKKGSCEDDGNADQDDDEDDDYVEPGPFRMLDPRVVTAVEFRNHIRRECELDKSNLDVQHVWAELGTMIWHTDSDWENLQSFCRHESSDLEHVNFRFITKRVDPADDIFEVETV